MFIYRVTYFQVKFGGGFYCAQIDQTDKPPIFVFNGFFMSLRAKFVTPGTSIYYYVVDFDPTKLSWKDFRYLKFHFLE